MQVASFFAIKTSDNGRSEGVDMEEERVRGAFQKIIRAHKIFLKALARRADKLTKGKNLQH
jgi:hypothetical protein